MNRRDLPRATTYAARDGSPSRRGGSGAYNSLRGVPPPRSRTTSFGRPERRGLGEIDTQQPPPMTAPGPRGTKRLDPFLTRVVVLVDEATEPGISEEDAERRRVELVNIVLDRGLEKTSMPAPITPITGGQAVAIALRKRLKSENEIAVQNTLTLLDELMRTCPYFYRYVANEQFFRRLWRFVVPDYKNGVKSMIPIFGKPKVHAGMRTGSDVSARVRILIRAWAEELSVMYNGRYDPHAGFLIERYNNKRSRVPFPEVPKTPGGLPWVCPVGNASSTWRGSSSHGGAQAGKETMTLAGVENTVNLFSNLVDNATSVADLKDDLCTELAERCKYIQENLTRLSMNMSKEEELTRAIAISEALEKSLGQYKNSIENGRLVRSIPTVDTVSMQSEDEGYDDLDRNGGSSRSLDRYSGRNDPRLKESERNAGRYSESSEMSSGGRDDWMDRERERDRERDRDRDRDREREGDRGRERDREREGERGRERDRGREREVERERAGEREREVLRERERDGVEYRGRERSYSPPLQRKMSGEKNKGPPRLASEKRSRRDPPKFAVARRQKSDGDLPNLALEKRKSGSSSVRKEKGLIQLPGEGDNDSGKEDGANEESFSMLAERYASQKVSSRRARSKGGSTSRSKSRGESNTRQPARQQQIGGGESTSNTSNQSLPARPGVGMNPNATFYHSTGGGLGYNPMLMVPNPYAMYGSVSHVPMQDPMGMYGAYQTVNPAMYYGSVNPGMYPSFSMPTMMGPMTAQSTPGGRSPAMQPLPSPGMQSIGHDTTAQNGAGQSGGQPRTPQQTIGPNAVVPPQSPLPGAAGQVQVASPQQQAMSSSFYASVPGQGGMMGQGGFPMMMGGGYSVGIGQVGDGGGGMGNEAEAAVYQSRMQQAAVAYHEAANAYRSVSGQAAVGVVGISTTAPAAGSGVAGLPAVGGQGGGQQGSGVAEQGNAGEG